MPRLYLVKSCQICHISYTPTGRRQLFCEGCRVASRRVRARAVYKQTPRICKGCSCEFKPRGGQTNCAACLPAACLARRKKACETSKAWKQANSERVEGLYKARYVQNKEKYKQAARRSAQRRSWSYKLYRGACCRAGVLNVTLTEADILSMFESQGGRCYWTGLPMDPNGGHRGAYKPSLDKLITAGDYTPDNVVLCTWFANRARNDMPPDEFDSLLLDLKESLTNGPNIHRTRKNSTFLGIPSELPIPQHAP